MRSDTSSQETAHAAYCLKAGNFAEAARICREVLRKDRRNAHALHLLGAAALELGEYDQAVSSYRKCTKIEPEAAGLHFMLGRALMAVGRYDEAVAAFDRSLALKPAAVTGGWKAAAFERQGRYRKARAVIAPYLEAGDVDGDMAELVARLDLHEQKYADAVAVAERYVNAPGVTAAQRARLLAAAGRAYEKLGRHGRAFESFRAANDSAPSPPFDPAAHTRRIDEIIESYSADRFPALPRAAQRPATPVFIAGMPRSGTTLVEQIIHAHPQAHGAGEIEDIDRAAREAGGAAPDAETVERLSGAYLARLAELGGDAERVVNKSLENYRNLGLIALVCPGARIVHCRRHPLDTCLSCFMGGLRPARAPWVTSLKHVGLVYRQYERLMLHWATVLDLPIFEIAYEDVVNDLEAAARRVIEFLDLPWDDACLRYHEAERPVLTASYAQVTKPIYRSAVGRYRHFEEHLGPLREALEHEGD